MKMAANSLDPLNLVHKGGSVVSNIFTPWKGGSSGSPSGDGLPTSAPTPVAPVSLNDQAALNSQQQFIDQQARQKSFGRTIFAGDTGGFKPNRPIAPRPGTMAPAVMPR